MKHHCIIILLFFSAFFASAQDHQEYIQKGDEAMNNRDYSLAKIWFEEVIYVVCNVHCINQLTTIWLADDSMKTIMGNTMRKCLSCLEANATDYMDTESMALLIKYYTEGIGTTINEARAEYWKMRLEELVHPNLNSNGQNRIRPPREKIKMQFFAGYAFNLKAPVGLTAGGMGKSVGWYLRFRSNLSFHDYSVVCSEKGIIPNSFLGGDFYETHNERKENVFIGTGGMMIKASPSFYFSVGVGYCAHAVLYKFYRIGHPEAEPKGEFWAKVDKALMNGVAFDLDGTYKIGGNFYGTLGVSFLNFSQVYANAGIGMFF